MYEACINFCFTTVDLTLQEEEKTVKKCQHNKRKSRLKYRENKLPFWRKNVIVRLFTDIDTSTCKIYI